jgi:hypothetical protein
VFGLGWAVAIGTNIIPHKFEALRKYVAFLETKKKRVSKASTKLAFHID